MSSEAMESANDLAAQQGPGEEPTEVSEAPVRSEATDGMDSQRDPLAELQAELEAERRAREAAEERALRWRADCENLRRRSMLESEQLRLNLIQDITGRFIPVLDDLDRALALAGKEAPPSWASGLEMVRKQFLALLAEYGLARMETVGQTFDPERHEAMLRVEDSGQPSNTILEELRPGYVLGARVIRPALVKVQA
ncbi:MAG: nucleotide exchange factor GrpE [Bacteroidota bacterium]